MNNCTFTGNLGASAEVKRLTGKGRNGDTLIIVEWSIAVRTYDNGQEGTLWVKCAAFGERFAKLADHMPKGSQVTVCGEVRLEEWTSQAGKHGATLKLIVRDVTLAPRRDGAASAPPAERPAETRPPAGVRPPATPPPAEKFSDDEIPF